MAGRFILLVAISDDGVQAAQSLVEKILARGLTRRLLQGRVQVFADPGLPTLPIHSRGLLIGRLFSGKGDRVGHGLDPRPCDDLHRHLLGDYWGEYIALKFSDGHPCRLRILREPSGAMQCLYGSHQGLSFVTSSVSLAISLGLARRYVDWSSIVRSLTCPYLRTGRTCIAGVSELLPGRVLSIDPSATSEMTAWSPWEFTGNRRRRSDARDASDAIRNAVSLATKALAEADGHVLLELSGGLDSSIVAACLSAAGVRTVFCTMTAPVPGTNEQPYAQLVADHLRAQLQIEELSVESARFDFPVDPDVVAPGAGILHYAVDQAISRRATALGVTSLFSGAGGDSVFCYLRSAAPAADAFLSGHLRRGTAAIGDLSTLHGCSIAKACRLTARKVMRGARAPWKMDHSFLSDTLPGASDLQHPWFHPPASTLPGDRERVFDLVGAQSFRDGMARGARWPLRMPLLTQPVLEACLAVPTWMWIARGRDRAIARSAFAGLLPVGITNRRSKATYLNYCGEMHARNRTRMLSYLEDGMLNSRQLLDLSALRHSLGTPLRPNDLTFMRIFDLCMIENWLRHQAGA
jgi:asparagine synthase (glutamine-hydrolysing)